MCAPECQPRAAGCPIRGSGPRARWRGGDMGALTTERAVSSWLRAGRSGRGPITVVDVPRQGASTKRSCAAPDSRRAPGLVQRLASGDVLADIRDRWSSRQRPNLVTAWAAQHPAARARTAIRRDDLVAAGRTAVAAWPRASPAVSRLAPGTASVHHGRLVFGRRPRTSLSHCGGRSPPSHAPAPSACWGRPAHPR